MAERIFVFFREFLFIAVLLIIGFMLLAAIPLRDTDVYIENKIRYYNNFGKEFDLGSGMTGHLRTFFQRSCVPPSRKISIIPLPTCLTKPPGCWPGISFFHPWLFSGSFED